MTPLTAADAQTQSADIVAANIARLRKLFPEAFTEGISAKDPKIDFDIFKQLLGGNTDEREEKYGLNWHGKRRHRQLALTTSTGTLRPVPGDGVDEATTKNIVIEGDNLEVLKLLQKSYSGQVKLIYIDPPYNTGNDFVYPDDFRDSIGNYKRLTGQEDDEGSKLTNNSETSGRFHTDWLNMIYPRLKLAKHLLKESGAIFISIGEVEVANTVYMCNEIFGEENRITICSRVAKKGGQKGVHFSPCVDYIVAYAKNIVELNPFREEISLNLAEQVYTKVETAGPRKGERYRSMGLYQAMLDIRANQRYFIKCPDGSLVIPPGVTFPNNKAEGEQVAPSDEDGVWRWTYGRFSQESRNGNVEFIKSDRTSLVTSDGAQAAWNVYYKIWLKDRLEDGQLPGNILEKFESRHSSSELKALDIPFDFPKPSALIKYLMMLVGVADGEICLDFFAGSGSTGHAAMELASETNSSLRFICVQLPEKTHVDSTEYKEGFVTIAEICKERLRRTAKRIRKENALYDGDLGFRVFKEDSSNIRTWEPDKADLPKTLEESTVHIKPDRTEADVLVELLLKLGLDLCVPIEAKTVAGKPVQSIGAGTLLVCLDESITRADAEPLALGIAAWHKQLTPAGESQVVFRDSAFEDDVAKSNLAAILQQHGLTNVRSL